METRFLAILSMPRNGTNYLGDLLGKFKEIESLYEIYHNKSVYINKRHITDKVIAYLNKTYQLQISNQNDPQLVKFVAENPQEILDLIDRYSNKKYVSFKIFPNHLSKENLKETIIKNKKIQKVIVKRNLLDVYFSSQFANSIKSWDRQDTTQLKLDFNPNKFLKWLFFQEDYYSFIEEELKQSNQEVKILEYEKIHSLDNNQEKFIFLYNFLHSAGLKLSQDNLFNNSQADLNKNIRTKQDRRTNRLEKVANPQVLVNTLEKNNLESLLV